MDTKIAGYEIEETLGESPWGRSYRARQVSLDRSVHLILLRPDEAVLARARVCAALTHPHLVSGIDFGECDEGPFLVTEWVEGPSVGEIVARAGAIADDRAIEIALAAAQALEHALENGLTHGSITPEALVIARGGNPKLRGFGSDRAETETEEDFRSPEAKRDEELDSLTDVYCLGMVLYVMLSGRHPFEDAPPAEVVNGQVVEEPFPLEQANRRLAPDTVALVARMMAWSPEDRFATPGELAEALESHLEELENRVTIRPKRIARKTVRRARGARPRRRRRR